MSNGADVLSFLRPNGGWVITGDDFDSIRYDEGVTPLTKAEFEAGFAQADEAKAQAQAAAQAQKQAILDRLGLTEEELRIVLGQGIIL